MVFPACQSVCKSIWTTNLFRETVIFRFGEELFDAAVEIYGSDESDDASQYKYIANKKKYRKGDKGPVLEGTQADLYFLLNMADQNCIAANRCIEYVTSNRLHLSAVLIQMIERIVDAMEHDDIKKRQICGEIIRKTYMDKNFADWEIIDIYEYMDMTSGPIIDCAIKGYR